MRHVVSHLLFAMKLTGKREASVALFLLLPFTSLLLVESLKCYCADHVIAEIPFPLTPCSSGNSCDTTGKCLVNLRLVENSGYLVETYTYRCVSDGDVEGIPSVGVLCGLDAPSPTQAILCCNNTDFCNRDLNPRTLLTSLPAMSPSPTPVMVLSPTSTPSAGHGNTGSTEALEAAIAGSVALFIIIGTAIAFSIFLCFLRVRKLKRERVRRVPQGMKEAGPTGEMELMDMTVTSGSGSGLPFLIQRTVARTIKITDLIGNGRYGQVYLGYYQGEPVAVKKFFSRDEKSWCRETEIYNTLLLRHDNILGFFASDMVSNNGVTELWLITQYHEYGSLYDFLVQEAVSPKVMLKMAISTCSGLAHLHTELFGTQAKPAIAHRDMKTKNVLVKNNLTCCIADFGLAVFKNQNEMNIPTNPKQGTKRYMAPEILNETINMKSFESFKQVDVYALGLILWELCRRCTGTSGVPEDYEVPLQGMVPTDPSFEDMHRVVVVERRQPTIPPRWHTEELLREMTKVMRECWYYTSTARPTAVYLKKKLLKMSHELEKMNYTNLDVQQAT